MKYVWIFLQCVCIIQWCTSVTYFSLNGSHWLVTQNGGNLTVKAQVPGGIYTDLYRNGIIGDPYYRFNDVAYSWISYSDWTYTKEFTVDEDTFLLQQHHLIFEGLDTVALVMLNNITIGTMFNMYRRYDLNVTGLLKPEINTLQVRFMSPVKFARQRAYQYSYEVPPNCPPPAQNGECHFNFIRKDASSFSWDWGPSFPTMGIWKNVFLQSYNTAVITYLTTETALVSASLWELKISIFFDGRPDGSLDVIIGELDVAHRQDTSTLADNHVEIVLRISDKVQPWWPSGYGVTKLYSAVVSYNGLSGDSDLKSFKIGFRTVQLVQDTISSGATFYFKINGIPVFAKGSNWIPADSFQERITESYVRQLLQSAVEANMNMLRVWGGGVYESEYFYEAADELGIMIWQDFMFACALYPTDEIFLEDVREEIVHQVRRLKAHPSIIIWAGNNENEGALANNWFNVSSSDYPRYYADYVKLYVSTIRSVVLNEDTSRPFVTSSPSNGIETIAEGWVAKDPQSPFYGDVHDYDYTQDSWNSSNYIVPRFASEFGLQSWCSLETLVRVSFPDVDLSMGSAFVNHRQHHTNGELEMKNEVAMHFKLPSSTNSSKNFAAFVYLTQINQAVGIKTEIELYRRSKSSLVDGRGFTMGALYWQLNDIWQAPTWASIEYGGKWKMLHYFARKFFYRNLISPYVDKDDVIVFYVSDDANAPSTKSKKYCKVNQTGNALWPSLKYRPLLQKQCRTARRRMERATTWNIKGRCYKWNSFQVGYEWNISFAKAHSAAQQVFRTSLSSIKTQCRCTNNSECFLHFTDLTASAFDAHLLLTNVSEAEFLPTSSKIASVRRVDNMTVEIHLNSSGISLFVWLECTGFSGWFSDNGFLMTQPEATVTFRSLIALDDIKLFARNLIVHSLSDIYR